MGLFDRLFGQEENQSQETVANQEISETEALDNQDLSTSESQAEQLSESETQVEKISSTASVEESESTVTEESEAEGVSESEESQVTVDNHFADVMADYYAKKAQVAAAAEKGETVTFEAVQTRKVEEKPEEVQALKTETEQEKYNRTLKKTRTGFAARLNEFFANFRRVDEEFFEELEEMLILSDVGVNVATQLTEDLRYEARLENVKKTEDLQRLIIEKLVDIYEKDDVYKEQINFQDGLTVML
ncbi:MAG: signal recognition particle receptor subunit alpha, partial [Streptococcus sp.]|nr:signal recognition particle receptor subunit alpha [Streptococcus sp.]